MMLIVVSVLTMTQFGAPIIESDYFYYTDATDTIFETDFWTVSSDSFDAHESYTDDLAYFLLQEGNFWETVELLNELEPVSYTHLPSPRDRSLSRMPSSA